jgi:Tol biopolymer transport system component
MLKLAALALGAALAAAPTSAWAGDPNLAYRTVESAHFVVYYYAPLDDVARRVAVVAERAHRTLSVALDHAPATKTIIVLVDDTDGANGFAGVLPRNAIQLYATGPDGPSQLADHEDWLYGLVAHEYTHILHLDTMGALPRLFNGVFGKTWAPNQIMPRWVIEGIATYEESKRSAGGRTRASNFEQLLRAAVLGGTELPLDQASGLPRAFPRGNVAYLYGSSFLRYVFDRFGDDALRRMSHTAGDYAPPFAINRQIAKVVGKPFTELYEDWRAQLRDRFGLQAMAVARRGEREGRALTHSAENNLLPRYSADGKELIWQQYDGYTLPRVRAMPVGADVAAARDVVQIDGMGPFDVLPDGSLVFEQGRVFRRDYAFEDLFRWDVTTHAVVRLTTGRRARDPAVSPDGRRIAYSENGHSTSTLAVMAAAPDAPGVVVWKGERFDQAYQPAWSPDGGRLAFSAWRAGGLRDILIVELATGKVTEVTRDRALDGYPSWSADGRYVFFDSDRTGILNIFAYDTQAGALWQVTNVTTGATRGRTSPDGTRLAYELQVAAGGLDLRELPLDPARWLPARPYVDDRPPPVVVRDDEAPVTAPRPYRPLETLAPQSWTGQLVTGDAPSLAIQTGGTDAVGLHGYALAVGLDLTNGESNVGASYGYSGWRPSFRISAARTLLDRGGWRVDGVNKAYREEDFGGSLSLGLPLESRPGSSWSLSFDYGGDWFRLVQAPLVPEDPNQRVPRAPLTNYVAVGVGARLGFTTVRSTTFALGAQYGFDGAVSLHLDEPALGASFRSLTVSYGLDLYQRLWGVSPTLFVRAVGAVRTGDLIGTGGFGLGGLGTQSIVQAIVQSTRAGSTGYLRGFPARSIVGNQYHLVNAEYRQELWRIERGLGTLPVYLRRVHLAGLTDVATAFDTTWDASRVRWSAGAALRLDAFFGYFVPGTFELGAAKGLTAGGVVQTWLLLTGSL